MGVLVESPAKVQDYFLPVPDIGDALISLESNSASKLLKDLGKVFVKYNTFDRFSISLVHRHFDLNEDEILVEAFAEDETTSVSLPWHLMGNEASPGDKDFLSSFQVQEKDFILPRSWYFDDEGTLVAFEYLSSHEQMSSVPQEFVDELFSTLKTLGLEKIIGLRRLPRRRDGQWWEVTPDGRRASVTKFGNKPEEISAGDQTVVVGWSFNEKGELHSFDNCSYCHVSICYFCPFKGK